MYPKVVEGDARPDAAVTVTGVSIAQLNPGFGTGVLITQLNPGFETGVSVTQLNPGIGTWSTGLCGCLEDCSNCCITCCCPCVTFGQNAEVIDKGNTSCVCAGITCYLLCHLACSAMYACTYRSKLRGLYSIPGGQCADYCVHCCCPLCAICQEHRELKNRGLDPSIGWVANEEKLNRQIRMTVAPAAQLGMTRT